MDDKGNRFLKDPGCASWIVMSLLGVAGMWAAFRVFPIWLGALVLMFASLGGFVEGKGLNGVESSFRDRLIAAWCGIILFGMLIGFAALLEWLGLGPFDYQML